jgi:hypothetical protein
VSFVEAVLEGGCTFARARFDKDSVFELVRFGSMALFGDPSFNSLADFDQATFYEVMFAEAVFRQGARFERAIFSDGVRFVGTTFGVPRGEDNPPESAAAVAAFRGADFQKPEKVLFLNINQNTDAPFRLRLAHAKVEGVSFEGIAWNRVSGRMVLQDELDLREALEKDRKAGGAARPTSIAEAVATAYRRLMVTFEARSQVDLAEDCYVGQQELKMLDPETPQLARAVTRVYGVLSRYGSSYGRAMAVLILLLAIFGFLYGMPLAGLRARADATIPSAGRGAPVPEFAKPFMRGLFHAFQVATFQRETRYAVASKAGQSLQAVESIAVPSQTALLLLALNRRFKRR